MAEVSPSARLDRRIEPLWHLRRLARAGAPSLPAGLLGAPIGTATSDSPFVLRLGPGEWLLRGHRKEEVHALIPPGLHHVAEVTDGHASYRLAGADVEECLAAACSLDLHIGSFPPGRCTRTILDRVPAVVHREDPLRFALIVDATYARHLESCFATRNI